MRKWMLVGLAFVFMANLAYAAYAEKSPVNNSHSKKRVSKNKVKVRKEDPYKAYLIVEATTGKVLEGYNTDFRWPPASVTKLMLSYIVLEKLQGGKLSLTDRIKVSKNAERMGGSQVFLKAGEVYSLEEMMKATLIASANDAAYAIAESIAGTADKFVDLMNEKAKALNMVDTVYHSVNGLPPPKGGQEDFTTCQDLFKLARALLKYPKLLEWTSLKNAPFRNGKTIMNNHNRLLKKMPIMDGLKTGYYRKAGYNIVATAKKGGLRLIAIMMGSPTSRTRDRIVADKLNRHFSRCEMVTIIRKGELIDRDIILADSRQKKIKGIANETFSYPLLRGKKNTIKKEISLPERWEGEIKKDQKLGEIAIKVEDELVGKIDIVSPVDIPRSDLVYKISERLSRVQEKGGRGLIKVEQDLTLEKVLKTGGSNLNIR
ncbi:MAG: D-alanyl-D-alanine carboxypeptidase family protein [Pseudomonadota bacterium]